jgi:hypothetical protein
MVMHQHVVKHRFPNLVGGFDAAIGQTLQELVTREGEIQSKSLFERSFQTPKVAKCEGSIRALDAIEQMCPNEVHELRVQIGNRTDCDWVGYGLNPVRLSYHWASDKEGASVFDGARTLIEGKILVAASQQTQSMRIEAPPTPGKYHLILTMVQEGVGWFEKKGFEHHELEVTVKGSDL